MSEKEKEKEDNEGEILLHHSCHEHPLRFRLVGYKSGMCYGCQAYISPIEKAYKCSDKDCDSGVMLHEECAEMPREISLSSHSQHSLIQKDYRRYYSYIRICAVCEDWIYRIGYFCSRYDDFCKFQVHLWCAHEFSTPKSRIDQHPSHPHHRLTLLLKSISLKCDACGVMQKGRSYVCSDCEYWIHESCAALPPTRDFNHLHHHALSLAYRVPPDYKRFGFKCRICFKTFSQKYWVYHCEKCRYVVHINCAIHCNSTMLCNINADEGEGVITLPTKNTVEEMIRSFVDKVGGGAKGEYKLHNANHQLRLVSSSLHDDEEDEEEDDDDGDDGDEVLYYGNKSELVCDGCTTPILDKKQKKSSHEYISCADCNYFLHLPCFHLPPELPSHPLHEDCDHILTLHESCGKLDFIWCLICSYPTNGLFYTCTKCRFIADVKCISLPDTIKHESHPQHCLKLHTKEVIKMDSNYWGERACGACGYLAYYRVYYRCDICEFVLHASCCLLPAAVNNPTWDKQPLPLTFDAAMNHPSRFYCEVCEEEMNPMTWMYHCRHSDVSIHPKCLLTASGWLQNLKFGQQYRIDKVHNHPLAFQLLTKLHCGVCGKRKVYSTRGFQCCSKKCEFAMCFDTCGGKFKDAVMIEESSNV